MRPQNNVIAKTFVLFFFLLMILLILAPFISAVEFPKGLLAAEQYNQLQAKEFLLNVSFFVAFIAGIVTLLSPCTLPLIPAFFTYAFKEKKQMTLMTLVFFAGFALMFMAMGVLAAALGNASIVLLQEQYSLFIQGAGIVLIFFGVLSLAGKGFPGIIIKRKTTHDTVGVFLYGLFFALGWTVCIGPILGGILSMAILFHNYFNAMILMFFYALGMFVPLFLFSYFYDSHHLEKIKWMKGTVYHFSWRGREHSIHTSNIIAGILFIGLGLIFIFGKGTTLVNGWTYFGIKYFFYVLQRSLLQGGIFFNILGIIVLCIVSYFIYKGIKMTKEEGE